MENLKVKTGSFLAALGTLEEAITLPFSVIVRDASIQRFEYTFEACWKSLKEYLKVREGVLCASPKSCFREAFQLGLLSEADAEETLKMVDDRNLTAHTYIEAIAQSIYEKLPGYLRIMHILAQAIRENPKL